MSEYTIVTDSTATIPDELVQKYDIKVAPQMVIFGEETLRDGVDISPADFYARLQTSSKPPTTSQATLPSFKSLFEPSAEAGVPVLAMVVSRKLSGTIQSAEQAKGMLGDARIEIVDSSSAAMGLGFQVLAVARARDSGASFEEALELAQRAIAHTGILFMVDTLEYLHRGGRIGGASRFFGTALNIKPILELNEGEIEAIERVRTKKKALGRILELVETKVSGMDSVRLATMHAAAEDDAHALLEEASGRFEPVETMVTPASPAIGAHTGPGTLGLIYSVGL